MTKKKTNLKKTFKEYKLFFLGLSIGFMFIVGMVVGISMSIDTSIVNQLQHYTQDVRSNDMFNPIIVNENNGFLEIELTSPHLTEIVNTDGADLLVSYWMIPNPIESVFDWVDRGIFINEFLIWGEELDSYCDTPDATDTYYTHFYRLWSVVDLVEGYTYGIYCDFYDADGTFWHCDDFTMPFGGEGFMLNLNVDPELPTEEEVQAVLLNCDFISFFEYQPLTDQEQFYTPPPGEGTEDTGAVADGWMNQFTIFSGIQNWVALLILMLIFGILGLIIFILIYFFKKKKGKKKKSKKKK